MPYDLKGRNVLITGGSRGLGAVLARTFAAEGCNIAINFQSSEAVARELANEVEEKYSVKATIIKACWAVNVKGKLALMRAALPTFRANPDGGVFLITSSIAGVSQGGSSMAYSVTKAAQLHLMKCLAASQGEKHFRGFLQFLLISVVIFVFGSHPLTIAQGNLYGEERIKSLKERAALKKETDLDDCANAFVMLAKNTSITGAKIQVGE
ncbi:hypothetical protein SLS56_008145 [Neofusicoccum ribis]|uniref:Uncharacterized protein n=1 Tax=Neofusicoccum ribis TaxID=45134 RepID=A0ABR3SL06_9PEZI